MKSLYKNFLLLIFFIIASSSPEIHSQDKAEKINSIMSKYADLGIFNGSVLVADKGKVIYEKGFGFANMEWKIPNTTETKFELGSVTKQFTAALIMQLVEDGRLNLDDKISDILDYYPKKNGSRITVHQLLTHTSGIPNYTNSPGFMQDLAYKNLSPEELIMTFADQPLNFEPGSQFSYSNSGYIVLGAIIEKLTGKPYEQVLEDKIFKPLGMNNSGYTHLDEIIPDRAAGYDNHFNHYTNAAYLNMSIPYSAGALYSTVDDLFKWDQGLYGDKILSAESKQKMFTGYVKDFKGKYGYGWDVGKESIDDNGDSVSYIMHGGSIFGFNSLIARIPGNQQLIVLLNNTGASSLNEMYDNIRKILYGQPVKEPVKPSVNQMAELIDQKGAEAGIDFYKSRKASDEEGKISEREINDLGYYLLRDDRPDDAVKIFKLNIEEHPESFNVYDSYAEALMDKGDNAGAIANYKKSIAIDPQNINAYDQLEKMGVKLDRPAERTAVKVDPGFYENLVGEYQLQPGFVLTVSSAEGKIYTQATGQPRFEIFPESETEYFLKVVDAQISFVKDEIGKYSKLILHQNGRDMPAERLK